MNIQFKTLGVRFYLLSPKGISTQQVLITTKSVSLAVEDYPEPSTPPVPITELEAIEKINQGVIFTFDGTIIPLATQ